jgi:hypothetical protein
VQPTHAIRSDMFRLSLRDGREESGRRRRSPYISTLRVPRARYREGNIVDGSGWIAKRLAHLRSLLDGEVSDEDRRSIEAEIADLSTE